MNHFRKRLLPENKKSEGALVVLLGYYIAIVIGANITWPDGIWKIFFTLYALLFAAAFVIVTRVGLREIYRRFGHALLILVIVPVAAIGFAGTYSWKRDIFIAMLVGILVYYWRRRERSPHLLNPPDKSSSESLANRDRVSKLALWLVITWTSLSFADRTFGSGWWFLQPLKVDPARFQEIRNRAADEWPDGQSDGLAVALSGGGYRAALLHAGVLHAVEDLALPVTAMGTISGGSIIGSFYTLGGSPSDFANAVKAGKFNLRRELLNGWELAHMTCPATDPLFGMRFFFFCDAYGRSDVQAKLFDRVLLGETKLSQLLPSSSGSGAPVIFVGAVDLRTGELLGFTRDALLRIPQYRSSGDLVSGRLPRMLADATSDSLGNLQELALSELVAGSGAFPGAINSIALERQEDNKETTTFNITDGGVADNYGLSLLLAAHELRPEWKQEFIMVSDGSMPLEGVDEVSGFTEFFRALNVVYASSGLHGFDNGDDSPLVLRLSPTNLEPRFTSEGELEQLEALSADRLEKLYKALPKSFRKERAVKSVEDLRNDLERSGSDISSNIHVTRSI